MKYRENPPAVLTAGKNFGALFAFTRGTPDIRFRLISSSGYDPCGYLGYELRIACPWLVRWGCTG